MSCPVTNVALFRHLYKQTGGDDEGHRKEVFLSLSPFLFPNEAELELTSVTNCLFVVGQAPKMPPFDYFDCCYCSWGRFYKVTTRTIFGTNIHRENLKDKCTKYIPCIFLFLKNNLQIMANIN
jgi:hypothetical protein